MEEEEPSGVVRVNHIRVINPTIYKLWKENSQFSDPSPVEVARDLRRLTGILSMPPVLWSPRIRDLPCHVPRLDFVCGVIGISIGHPHSHVHISPGKTKFYSHTVVGQRLL